MRSTAQVARALGVLAVIGSGFLAGAAVAPADAAPREASQHEVVAPHLTSSEYTGYSISIAWTHPSPAEVLQFCFYVDGSSFGCDPYALTGTTIPLTMGDDRFYCGAEITAVADYGSGQVSGLSNEVPASCS